MSPPNLSLFMIMVCFFAAYVVVKRLLLDPVQEVLAERHRRIGGAEETWAAKMADHASTAERLKSELEDAARSAAATRGRFRAEAQQEKQETLEAARAEAQERLDAALEQLESEADAARQELRGKARGLARELASKLLAREVAS